MERQEGEETQLAAPTKSARFPGRGRLDHVGDLQLGADDPAPDARRRHCWVMAVFDDSASFARQAPIVADLLAPGLRMDEM